MSRISQCDSILAALKRGQVITPLDAMQDFNCMRLAARINDLRAMGHEIITHDKHAPSGKRFAGYSMPQATLEQGEMFARLVTR